MRTHYVLASLFRNMTITPEMEKHFEESAPVKTVTMTFPSEELMFQQMQELSQSANWRLPMEWSTCEQYVALLHELYSTEKFWHYVNHVYRPQCDQEYEFLLCDEIEAMFGLFAFHLKCIHLNYDMFMLCEILGAL